MASFKKIIRKDGTRVYEIIVSRGRDRETRKLFTPYTMRYEPPQSLSDKQAEKKVREVAAKFEEDCRKGLVKTKSEIMKERKAKAEAQKKIMTVQQVFDWMQEESVENRTYYGYHINKLMAQAVLKEIASYPIGEVPDDSIRRCFMILQRLTHRIGNKKKQLMSSTKKLYSGALKNIFRFAVDKGLIDEVPQIFSRCRIKKNKDEIKEKSFMDINESKQFIEAVDKLNMSWKVLYLFMLDTGCRIGECVSFRWSSINLDTGKIIVQHNCRYVGRMKADGCDEPIEYNLRPKTGKIRTGVLGEHMLNVLREWKEIQHARGHDKDGFVFTMPNGKTFIPNTVRANLVRLCKKNNLKLIHPHSLRHTTASIMISSGVDILTVSQKLGHSQTSTTLNIYSHAIEDNRIKSQQIYNDVLYK